MYFSRSRAAALRFSYILSTSCFAIAVSAAHPGCYALNVVERVCERTHDGNLSAHYRAQRV